MTNDRMGGSGILYCSISDNRSLSTARGRGVPKLRDNCEQLSLQVGALLPGLQDLPTGAVFAVLAEFFLPGV